VARRLPDTDYTTILRECVKAVRETQSSIRKTFAELELRPESVSANFDKIVRKSGDRTKAMLHIDAAGEDQCMRLIQNVFPKGLQIVGEESLADFSGWREPTGLLLDMIDGSDLAEMSIPVWCSALAIYDRDKRRIVGSIVALATGQIYSAVDGVDEVRVEIEGQPASMVWGCSNTTSLRDARVAHYGQKPKNALATYNNPFFSDFLERMKQDNEAQFRLLNFGGNPMIVRLADRVKVENRGVVTAGIDAVFECHGQQLHDVIPAAYIAKRAGAFFCDLDGCEFTDEIIGELMQNPKTRITYVIAATKDLALELVSVLKPKRTIVPNVIGASRNKKLPRKKPEQLQFDSLLQ